MTIKELVEAAAKITLVTRACIGCESKFRVTPESPQAYCCETCRYLREGSNLKTKKMRKVHAMRF